MENHNILWLNEWTNLAVSDYWLESGGRGKKNSHIKCFIFDRKKKTWMKNLPSMMMYCRHIVKFNDCKINIFYFKIFYKYCPCFRMLHNLLWLPSEICPSRGRDRRSGELGGGRSQLRVPALVQWTQLWHWAAPRCDWGGGPHCLPHLQGLRQNKQHGELVNYNCVTMDFIHLYSFND